MVESVVGQANTGNDQNSCFSIVSAITKANGQNNANSNLGNRTTLNRGNDTSGNSYYLRPSTSNPLNIPMISPRNGVYDTYTVGNDGTQGANIEVLPVVGQNLTIRVQAGLSWVPGATAFVFRRDDALNRQFKGTVVSYTGNDLVLNDIRDLKGDYGGQLDNDGRPKYSYVIQCVELYTPPASLWTPEKIAIDSVGNLFIHEDATSRDALRMYSTVNKTMKTIVTYGSNQSNGFLYDNTTTNRDGRAQVNQCRGGLTLDKKTGIVVLNEYSYNNIRPVVNNSKITFSGNALTMARTQEGISTFPRVGSGSYRDGNQDSAYITHPTAAAFDPINKRLFVFEDTPIRMIYYADSTGKTPTNDDYYYSCLINAPGGTTILDMVVDTSGNLFYIAAGRSCIFKLVLPPFPAAGEAKDKYHKMPAGSTGVCIFDGSHDNNTGYFTWANNDTRPIPPADLPPLTRPMIFAGKFSTLGYVDDVSGNAQFCLPTGLSIDSKNIIYVADYGNSVIRGIYPNGTVFTVAGTFRPPDSTTPSTQDDLTVFGAATNFGDGPNSSAGFSAPMSVAVDSEDNIYVLDRGMNAKNNKKLKLTVTGNPVEYYAGPAWPYASDTTKCNSFTRIRKIVKIPPPSAPASFALVDADSISATFSWASETAVTGFEDKGFAAYFQFLIKTTAAATEVTYAIDGTTPYNPANRGTTASRFITSNASNPLQRGFYQNNMITLPLPPLSGGAAYSSIKLVAFNKSGQNASNALTSVVIPELYRNYTVSVCGQGATTGGFRNGGPLVTQFLNIRGIAADSTGNLYVADWNNYVIRKIDRTGTSSTFFGTGVAGASLTTLNVAFWVKFSYGGGWPMYVVDANNNRVLSITSAGVATKLNTSGLALPVLDGSLTLDSANNVYVTAASTHCIYMITPAGVASLFAGSPGVVGSDDGTALNARFNTPQDIHYDTKYACLYVCDAGNNLIRKIVITNPPNGTGYVNTLAGNNVAGYTNGLGSAAAFNYPIGVITNSKGYLYVTDYNNHCIRKVSPAGLVSICSGTPGVAGSAIDGSTQVTAYNTSTSTVKYNIPQGICVNSTGMIYIAESGSPRPVIRALSTIPPPTLPTSYRLTTVTPTSITIGWAGDTGATSYSFMIDPSSPSDVMPTVPVGTNTATFTGLTESTKYTIFMTLTNIMGSVYSPGLVYTTKIDSTAINLAAPITKSFSLTGTTTSMVMATLQWTGMTRVTARSYTLTPTSGAPITGTMPLNQASPFTVSGLQPSTAYTATITGTISGVPDIQSATATTAPPATTYTATTNQQTFTTGAAAPPLYIGTIAGVKGAALGPTTATPTPTANLLSTQLNMVREIVSDGAGNFYIAAKTCILKMSPPETPPSLYVFDATQTTPTPMALSNPPLGLPGSTLTLIAGSATAGAPSTTLQTGAAIRFTNIGGMVYSQAQNCLYVGDMAGNHVVVKVTLTGTPTAIVVAGTAPNTPFQHPKGFALDPDGSIYVNSYSTAIMWKLPSNGGAPVQISTAANQYQAGMKRFPDGSLYVACANNHTIRKYTPSATNPGTFVESIFAGASGAGGFIDGPLATARFNYPQSLVVDSRYNIYIYDAHNYAIRVISGGNVYTLLGGPTTPLGAGNIDGPVTSARVTGQTYVSDGNGSYAPLFCDSNDNLYFSDTNNGTIRLITTFPASQVITQTQLDYYKTSGAQASSAVAQNVSSAIAQNTSRAQASSAVAQVASQAVASSAIQQNALSAPVAAKNQVFSAFGPIKTDLGSYAATIYPSSVSPTGPQPARSGTGLMDAPTAMTNLRTRMGELQTWLANLAAAVSPIFAIAPMYQDRSLQFKVSDPYLESVGIFKIYDAMRMAYITIDATNGYMVPNIATPSNRPFVNGRRPTASGASGVTTILPTDKAVSPGNITVPATAVTTTSGASGIWNIYFDTVARRYFYTNTSGVSQYEHPIPPIFSGSDTVIIDKSTDFLSPGWIKLRNTSPDQPYLAYYLNTATTETTWVHPNLPPDPTTSTPQTDATLKGPWKKYISTDTSKSPSTSGKSFYVNGVTLEAQWEFPDIYFDQGPSTAQQASSSVAQYESSAKVSSAVAQKDSSAQQQAVSGAQASSAIQQRDSGGQQQKDSSAQFQRDSSAVQQRDSGGQQQKDSSAKFQRDSSAIQQKDSSAQFQRDSSAIQQRDSGGQQQKDSSAKFQRDSSAFQQTASSSFQQRDLAVAVAAKDVIKTPMLTLAALIARQLQAMYSSGTPPDPNIITTLQNDMQSLQTMKANLLNSATPIFQLSPDYQDQGLQLFVQDNTLNSFGIRKVFDTLRNGYVFLNAQNNIINPPLTPYSRAYTSGAQRGGAERKHKKDSRKSGVLFYKV